MFIAVLLNLLHYFYHWVQYDKTRNVVHGKAFEVKHKYTDFFVLELTDTQNLLGILICIKFPWYVIKAVF